ncbi:hypothetical protein RHCRD62_20686 [Rhodococcus sp. RD6.2]|nr:hypothetical protein RHCRD62_20686 [Rhodococcus sp. RD6.2]
MALPIDPQGHRLPRAPCALGNQSAVHQIRLGALDIDTDCAQARNQVNPRGVAADGVCGRRNHVQRTVIRDLRTEFAPDAVLDANRQDRRDERVPERARVRLHAATLASTVFGVDDRQHRGRSTVESTRSPPPATTRLVSRSSGGAEPDSLSTTTRLE